MQKKHVLSRSRRVFLQVVSLHNDSQIKFLKHHQKDSDALLGSMLQRKTNLMYGQDAMKVADGICEEASSAVVDLVLKARTETLR